LREVARLHKMARPQPGQLHHRSQAVFSSLG
jgi:hypothetical protein